MPQNTDTLILGVIIGFFPAALVAFVTHLLQQIENKRERRNKVIQERIDLIEGKCNEYLDWFNSIPYQTETIFSDKDNYVAIMRVNGPYLKNLVSTVFYIDSRDKDLRTEVENYLLVLKKAKDLVFEIREGYIKGVPKGKLYVDLYQKHQEIEEELVIPYSRIISMLTSYKMNNV